MRKISALLAVLFLLLPSAFSTAQEVDSGALEETYQEEQAAESGAEAEVEEISADVVTSASYAKVKLNFIQRLGIALAIVAAQALLIWVFWYLFKRLNVKIEYAGKDKIKPLTIKKFRLLTAKQIINIIEVFLKLLKYVITAVQLFLTIPIVFSLFSATKNLASTLFGYILNPLKNIAIDVVKYIPNLFTIIIIVLITRYVLRGLKFFAAQIDRGKLVIPHFYADWAMPTLRILQVLLWAFTVAIIYPYLPGSDSKAFQGVSVFVGIIFSLGSSTAIGNLVAGLVITYMRPFKIGDRVQIKEITGFVVEKNMMVVRLKTQRTNMLHFPI